MEDSPEALMELKSNVSRETINKLDVYRSLILAEKQSLISKKDKNLLWIRHFYDSLRISDLIREKKQNIIDIGSGSGLPGIPLSLFYNGENSIFLCENRRKRAEFLEHCIHALKLKNGGKAEELDSPINLIIKTKCPTKWIIEDLETGQRYKANGQTEVGKMFDLINNKK